MYEIVVLWYRPTATAGYLLDCTVAGTAWRPEERQDPWSLQVGCRLHARPYRTSLPTGNLGSWHLPSTYPTGTLYSTISWSHTFLYLSQVRAREEGANEHLPRPVSLCYWHAKLCRPEPFSQCCGGRRPDQLHQGTSKFLGYTEHFFDLPKLSPSHRLFTLWQHGKLSKRNRWCLPSCVVYTGAIRNKYTYPSVDGQYVHKSFDEDADI